MKKRFISAAIFLSLVFVIMSCQKINKSNAAADDFYAKMKTGDYNKLADMVIPGGYDVTPRDRWIEVFKMHNDLCGAIKDYKQISFAVKSNDNGTYTTLIYKSDCEKRTIYEKFRFKEKDGKMYLTHYSFNENEDEIKD